MEKNKNDNKLERKDVGGIYCTQMTIFKMITGIIGPLQDSGKEKCEDMLRDMFSYCELQFEDRPDLAKHEGCLHYTFMLLKLPLVDGESPDLLASFRFDKD